MAKNLTKSPAPMLAMDKGLKNMESKAASSNYVKGAAYDAPMENNMKRKMQGHEGAMPSPDMQGYT